MPNFTNNDENFLSLKPLSRLELENVILNSKCKYCSASDYNRVYNISYLSNGFFINQKTENEHIVQKGYGTFNFEGNDIGLMNIQYLEKLNSENIKSPFNINNPFYSQLDDYQIGPFYIVDSYNENFLESRRNITQLLYSGPNNRRLLTVYKDEAEKW